ncbi:MAG: tRNA 4-thiouridine(8) synthase ThiI [Chloroflexi bacterium]|nr:tRNA 4-thiouridine(8) synthase ThiI [Chloroflexota bacterium]
MLAPSVAVAPGRVYLLVRFFHEIALKGKNKPFFVRLALRNLKEALKDTGVLDVRLGALEALLAFGEESDVAPVLDRLSTVFGVERIARVYPVAPTLDAIKAEAARLLHGRSSASFRITAHRADKSFPLNSPAINRELGAYVGQVTGWRVDLDHPELDLQVYVRRRDALLFLDTVRGPGGMPVGVSGKVMALLSGGIDSPVASWRMMGRGCRVLFTHFHGFPLVEGTSREKAVELARLLARHQFRSRLFLVPFGGLQREIITSTPPDYRVLLYRRFMFRIAEALALRHGARALVTGESLGQVSSQTLENMAVIERVTTMPVLRPLVSMDKAEIEVQARRLGSYPISIIPDQDCCSLFVPKHPVTRGRLEDVEKLEQGLDVERLVRDALAQVEEKTFLWPEQEATVSPAVRS